MQSRLRLMAILSLFAATFLLVGTRTAGAASATATINSISATGVGGVGYGVSRLMRGLVSRPDTY